MTIELIDGALDSISVSRIVSQVLRWLAFEPDAIEHMRPQTPTRRDWIAVLDGKNVGVGTCGLRIGTEQSGAAWSMLFVLREARHRGVGGLLYRRVSEHARELGRSQLHMYSFEDDPDTLGFAQRHGFAVVARVRGLRLPLDRCPRLRPEPPAGVRITTLAERPDLAGGVWQTARETIPEIPFDDDDAPMQAGTYEQFTASQLAGPRHIPEATFMALHDDTVVGYGKLGWISRSDGIADHQMIAVRRAWRGRGIAQALQAAQIAWAIDNGLSELRIGNDERNTAARALNAPYPYMPLPDFLHLRGPTATANRRPDPQPPTKPPVPIKEAMQRRKRSKGVAGSTPAPVLASGGVTGPGGPESRSAWPAAPTGRDGLDSL